MKFKYFICFECMCEKLAYYFIQFCIFIISYNWSLSVSAPINRIRSRETRTRNFIRDGVALTRQIVRRGRTRWLKRNTGNEYLIQAWPRHKSGKVRCKLPPLVVMVFMGHSRLSVEQVATGNCSRQRVGTYILRKTIDGGRNHRLEFRDEWNWRIPRSDARRVRRAKPVREPRVVLSRAAECVEVAGSTARRL